MDLRARADDADLVRAAQAGDGEAFGVLFDRWSARVLDVAYRIVRDREVAAEVVQDAFLAAWTGLARLEQVESFGGWVLRISRNRALNRLERERRSIPVGDEETTEMVDRRTEHASGDEAGDAAARAEDAALVWAAAAALGPRDASVLDLHLRHGLSPGEIAEELGITPNSAHQVLFRLRARLGDAVRACVLWRAGHPACPDLARAVVAAGISAFGADAVRVIGAHAADCDACTQRQAGRLSPEALFAAAPLLVVGPEVLAAIRLGLARAGVPVGDPPAAPGGGSSDGSGPGDDGADPPPTDRGRAGAARRPAVVAVAAGALVLVVVAILLLADDGADPEDVATDGVPSSSESSGSASSESSGSASSSTSTASPQGVSSLPSPVPTSTTTTGPSADVGTTSEPGLVVETPPVRPPTETTTTASPPPPTPPEPPPAPPTITSFTATRTPGPGCATPSARIALSWSTSAATDIRLTGPDAPTAPQPPTGTTTACSPTPATYLLTAEGPGGTTTQPATA